MCCAHQACKSHAACHLPLPLPLPLHALACTTVSTYLVCTLSFVLKMRVRNLFAATLPSAPPFHFRRPHNLRSMPEPVQATILQNPSKSRPLNVVTEDDGDGGHGEGTQAPPAAPPAAYVAPAGVPYVDEEDKKPGVTFWI